MHRNVESLSAFKADDSVVLCLQFNFGVSCKKISPEMYCGNSVLAPSGISVLTPWKFASLHATNAEFCRLPVLFIEFRKFHCIAKLFFVLFDCVVRFSISKVIEKLRYVMWEQSTLPNVFDLKLSKLILSLRLYYRNYFK